MFFPRMNDRFVCANETLHFDIYIQNIVKTVVCQKKSCNYEKEIFLQKINIFICLLVNIHDQWNFFFSSDFSTLIAKIKEVDICCNFYIKNFY